MLIAVSAILIAIVVHFSIIAILLLILFRVSVIAVVNFVCLLRTCDRYCTFEFIDQYHYKF